MKTQYETVVGLEIHVQLNTQSKIFCSDPVAFGGSPNTHVSAISLAHPGTLPRLNKAVLENAIRLGLALGCSINLHSRFDRKNYFYADLPKGYQITQDAAPICIGGTLLGKRIHHIHMEEDAGKSMHDQHPTASFIDLNRAGVPLLEIVTEPDFRSAEEVTAFMEGMRSLVRWLGVSDGNMEEGSMRCDVNVSVRPLGQASFGQRCEIKNINSMRFARKAIEFEVARQIRILETSGSVTQETRGFDADKGQTFSQREKELVHDYRYFPDPDLPPIELSSAEVERIRAAMPPLPQAVASRLQTEFALPEIDVNSLIQDRETAFYFLEMLETTPIHLCKALANFFIQRLLPWVSDRKCAVREYPLPADRIRAYLHLMDAGKLSASTAAQQLLPAMLQNPDKAPDHLAESLNLFQSSDTQLLETLAEQLLAEFPDKVAEYQKGKKGLIGFFMGELMKRSKGKADPKRSTEILQEKLASSRPK